MKHISLLFNDPIVIREFKDKTREFKITDGKFDVHPTIHILHRDYIPEVRDIRHLSVKEVPDAYNIKQTEFLANSDCSKFHSTSQCFIITTIGANVQRWESIEDIDTIREKLMLLK